MKKWILILVMGLLLIGVNLYAADGDLIVNNNLGVGNTSPTYKLDVSGDVRFTGILQGGSVPWARLTTFPSACATGQYVSGIGSTLTCSTPAGGGGGLSGSGTANYISKWTGSSSLGNSSIYDSGNGLTVTFTSNQGITANQATAGNQASLTFSDQGSAKWQIGKQTDNTFFIWDQAVTRNSFWAGGGNVGLAANGGNVGIGTITPSYQLQLTTDSAAKPSTNTWTIASDARLKTDIQSYTKGLKEILQITPVTYKYNGKGGIGHNKFKKIDPATGLETETETIDTELLSKTNVGVLAQDIQSVVPEAVSSHKGKINKDDAEETDLLDFNSHSLTFILINAVKELKAEIDLLQAQIADLKGKVK